MEERGDGPVKYASGELRRRGVESIGQVLGGQGPCHEGADVGVPQMVLQSKIRDEEGGVSRTFEMRAVSRWFGSGSGSGSSSSSNRKLHFVFDSDGDTDPDTDAWGKGMRPGSRSAPRVDVGDGINPGEVEASAAFIPLPRC